MPQLGGKVLQAWLEAAQCLLYHLVHGSRVTCRHLLSYGSNIQVVIVVH